MFTHASWSERRSESYERLAFLGDSVLSLAVTTYLYPRFEAERFGAGRLTKIRAQAVSGRSCKEVAERLDLPRRLEDSAPEGVSAAALEHPEDAKSELQELLARRGESVGYRVISEEGPPHQRTFAVRAVVNGREVGNGSGRSKKDAEQAAARAALEELES